VLGLGCLSRANGMLAPASTFTPLPLSFRLKHQMSLSIRPKHQTPLSIRPKHPIPLSIRSKHKTPLSIQPKHPIGDTGLFPARIHNAHAACHVMPCQLHNRPATRQRQSCIYTYICTYIYAYIYIHIYIYIYIYIYILV